MYKLKALCCLTFCCLLVSSKGNAFSQPEITSTISGSKLVIGQVIKLEINVKADKNTIVSWQLCDELFKRSEQFILLQVNSSVSGNYYKHQILFTSSKPLQLTVDGLPVVINQKKKITKPFKVNFIPEPLPLKLNDIKPIEHIGFLYPLRSLIFFLLIPLLLTAISFILFKVLKRQPALDPLALQQLSIKKLNILETAAVDQTLNIDALADQAWSVFINYVEIGLAPPGKHPITTTSRRDDLATVVFQEKLDKIKFSPPQLAQMLYVLFLSDVKEFITQNKSNTSLLPDKNK